MATPELCSYIARARRDDSQPVPDLNPARPTAVVKAISSGSWEQGNVARDFFTQWKAVYVDPPST